MATDAKKIIQNLRDFYDFGGKTVLTVGAGGGQLMGYWRYAKRIVAVDQDAAAIHQLIAAAGQLDFPCDYKILKADFLRVQEKADVVLFEFSLHEMPDPVAAILHARALAPEVIVLDHAPGSEWAYYVCEEVLVTQSYQAMNLTGVRKQIIFDAAQHFTDHGELHAKVAVQGPLAVERISRFKQDNEIVIPMRYGVTQL